MTSVLFVCLGNICRSPLAEGVFRHTVEQAGHGGRVLIDSAGIGNWHRGNPPDPRSVEVAALNGIDISNLRARQVERHDFDRFDLILAMDRDNLASLRRMSGPDQTARIRLFLERPARDVPDPYYGGADGFQDVYGLVKSGCLDLLEELRLV
ncbi:low molecular weight protein-tyrosine-phosphatase [Roseibium aggregatum]|uniref:protein-tyrosine-phosphatase n=1 Tax=Roseibium aggregatum TaxID=187304 RepID=A0A926S9F0_9HYPH|nr:low molecular weight protein-tyrosine-phosphatase [Roseibium aggregatum]MBD1546834.1 low molecular weight phosphotyrosine protein phosphatase [Roseibium aggregatum]